MSDADTNQMRSKLLNEYLKFTVLWPQKRWGVSTRLLFIIANSENPDFALKVFNAVDLNETDHLFRIEEVMKRMHSKIPSTRDINREDIRDDWAKTVGAVYRSLLYRIQGFDVIRDHDYKDLFNDNSKVLVMQNSARNDFWKTILPVVTICSNTLVMHSELSYLYRISFYSQQHYLRELHDRPYRLNNIAWKYFRLTSCSNMTSKEIWENLGFLVKSNLQQQGLLGVSQWIQWGFR